MGEKKLRIGEVTQKGCYKGLERRETSL